MLTVLSLVAAFLLGILAGVLCLIQMQAIISAGIIKELEDRGYLRLRTPEDS